jgi:hypothetical protein
MDFSLSLALHVPPFVAVYIISLMISATGMGIAARHRVIGNRRKQQRSILETEKPKQIGPPNAIDDF